MSSATRRPVRTVMALGVAWGRRQRRWSVSLVPLAAILLVGAAAVAASSSDRLGLLDDTGLLPRPVFATTDDVSLREPSTDVEVVGFHQARHPGAQQLVGTDAGAPQRTLPHRGRGTGSRTAADVVAAPDEPVLAPVSGRVIRAGSYDLYSRYPDHYVVIEPEDRPGWEVKVLHVEGLRVQSGDRVSASRTVVGRRPRALPFESQVDEVSEDRNWPHVHVEVVAP